MMIVFSGDEALFAHTHTHTHTYTHTHTHTHTLTQYKYLKEQKNRKKMITI